MQSLQSCPSCRLPAMDDRDTQVGFETLDVPGWTPGSTWQIYPLRVGCLQKGLFGHSVRGAAGQGLDIPVIQLIQALNVDNFKAAGLEEFFCPLIGVMVH